MTDVFSRRQRSKIMAAIKGRGTKSTELTLRRLLRKSGIKGWRSHLISLPGKPDFTFRDRRLAIFIDGCFWHGCGRCKRNLKPSTNVDFWSAKFRANRRRARLANRRLRARGWSVLRIWEHDLKRPAKCLARITRLIKVR